MYSLTVKNDQPGVILRQVALMEKGNLYNDTLILKNDNVRGCFKAFALENNVQCLCANYSVTDDSYFHKKPVKSGFFTIRIQEIFNDSSPQGITGQKCSTFARSKNYSAFLTSSSDDFSFFVPKNSNIKMLEVSMPRMFLIHQLGINCSGSFLKKHFEIKGRVNDGDLSSLLVRKHFRKIVADTNKSFTDLDSLKKNVESILDRIFKSIRYSLDDFAESSKVKISTDEIKRLIAVRGYLDAQLLKPTFKSLTKIALMSSTSLKIKFKRMYGTSVFKYFQRVRMQRARILLLTHKYSVGEIGHQLGYLNLTNFSIAFNKEFQQLPNEILFVNK